MKTTPLSVIHPTWIFPVFKRDRVLFGISVADTSGKSYYLTAHGDGWRTSQTGFADKGRQSVVRFWDADQRSIYEETKPTGYDARSRPWFSPALSTEGVFWTLPYPFYECKEVGITASMASKTGIDGGQTVVAFDILLATPMKHGGADSSPLKALTGMSGSVS